jgi:hypothetical protein
MGIREVEFQPMGATTKKSQHRPPGQNCSQKKADNSFHICPSCDAWSTLVIEAGNSESPPYLRADTKWWIEHSGGQVRIVILLKVKGSNRKIRVLKYVPIYRPPTYPNARNVPNVVPNLVADITIDQSANPSQIQGTPLTLSLIKSSIARLIRQMK